MQRDYHGIILFGPPGVGKGAQASILSRDYDLVHLSTGDLIREEIHQGTALGKKVEEAVRHGRFADDQTVLDIVMSRIDRPEFQDGFVMDGFPRNLKQAELLDALLQDRGLKVTSAILIQAPDEVVLRRLAGRRVCSRCRATYHEEFNRSRTAGICDRCGGVLERRHDDDPVTHAERLQTYRQETAPLAEYYNRGGALRKVDGNQPIKKVAVEIRRILNGVHAS